MDLLNIKKAFTDLITWIKEGFTQKADLVDGKVPFSQGGSPVVVQATEPTPAEVTAAKEGTVWLIHE